MNISILPTKEYFEGVMRRDSIVKSHFIAYGDDEGMFTIYKNRIDGVTGEGFTEEEVRSYVIELVDLTLEN
jgi:hypothetical protein